MTSMELVVESLRIGYDPEGLSAPLAKEGWIKRGKDWLRLLASDLQKRFGGTFEIKALRGLSHQSGTVRLLFHAKGASLVFEGNLEGGFVVRGRTAKGFDLPDQPLTLLFIEEGRVPDLLERTLTGAIDA